MKNIYQAKDGAIYLRNGGKSTRLSHQQINDLVLVVFELDDFDFDEYKKAYSTEIDSLNALLYAAKKVIEWETENFRDSTNRIYAMRLLKEAVESFTPCKAGGDA